MNMKKIILIAFILSGMAALMYEVIWTRPLSLVFGSTTYALSTILAAFMAGLALGSYLISKLVDKIRNLPAAYALLELGIGIYAVLLITIFSYLPSLYVPLYNAFHTQFHFFSLIQFILIFFLLLIPTSLMGATFPIVAKFYIKEETGSGIGVLYAGNTLGAMVGSFSAGFMLIPILGIQYSIIFAGLLNLVVGSFILFLSSPSFAKKIIPIGVILFLIFAGAGSYNIKRLTFGSFFYGHLPEQYIEDSELLFYKDGLYGTVAVLAHDGVKSLMIDGKGQGGTSFADARTVFLLAYFPLLLHPDPKTSLNIGLGTGITSGILSNHTLAETIEIDPAIIEASEHFKDVNKDVLNQPDHRLIIADARNHLLLTDKKYDIIASEPSDPWQSASMSLYSKEFYEIVKDHLNEDGLFAQWVPIYEFGAEDFRIFYRTFHVVFPHVVAFGTVGKDENVGEYQFYTTEIILIGSADVIELNWDEIDEKIKNPEIFQDLYFARAEHIDQLKNLFYFTDEQMQGYGDGYPLITDDNPVLEFSSAKTMISGGDPRRVINDIEDFLGGKK